MGRREENIIQRTHSETKMPLGRVGFQFGLNKEKYISSFSPSLSYSVLKV